MSARHAPRHALLAVLALAGCGGKASGVELRLYPCPLVGGEPSSVTVAIQNYDAGGEPLGDRLEKSFSIGDPAVFSDDYATVEFIPPAGTATADFTVTWGGGGVESVAAYMQVAVPKVGGAIVLGSDECEAPNMTTGPSSTGDATTGGDTSGTGTGTGTTGSTGTTSEGTTSSSGTTWESTTDASTSSTSSSSTGGSTGGPQEGDPCDMPGALICDGGPGVLGQFLLCDGDLMQWQHSEPMCDLAAACPPELGFVNPKLVGCLGDGMTWSCACADVDMMTMMPKECPMDGVSKCGETIPDVGVKIELCVTEGDKLIHYAGTCPKCVEDVPGQPLCAPQ